MIKRYDVTTTAVRQMNNGEWVSYKDHEQQLSELRAENEKYKAIARHYFTPQDENDKFCNYCDLYITDDVHMRELK